MGSTVFHPENTYPLAVVVCVCVVVVVVVVVVVMTRHGNKTNFFLMITYPSQLSTHQSSTNPCHDVRLHRVRAPTQINPRPVFVSLDSSLQTISLVLQYSLRVVPTDDGRVYACLSDS